MNTRCAVPALIRLTVRSTNLLLHNTSVSYAHISMLVRVSLARTLVIFTLLKRQVVLPTSTHEWTNIPKNTYAVRQKFVRLSN